MKKLILAIAALALIASPALAADWNMYGSARMATWYVDTDDADSAFAPGDPSFSNHIGVDDEGVQWELQGNSRLGARVKAENVSGRVELALTSADTHDGGVNTRLIYGDWNFGAGKFRVGKGYTPSSQFISGQAIGGDLGLLGIGTNYGRRPGSAQLMFGGFTVALIEPNTTNGDAWGTYIGGDVDAYLPKIEAGWGMSMDTFSFNLMGGFQTIEVEDVGAADEDIDVTSYIIGGDVAFNIGAAYIKACGSFGQNWTNARWSDLGFVSDAAAAGRWDGDDDVDDSDNWQVALVGGMKFTDMVSFEIGGGYRSADSDTPGAEEDEAYSIYGQAPIALAPGVFVIPEVGFFNYMDGADDEDAGDAFYLGAKWQIDF